MCAALSEAASLTSQAGTEARDKILAQLGGEDQQSLRAGLEECLRQLGGAMTLGVRDDYDVEMFFMLRLKSAGPTASRLLDYDVAILQHLSQRTQPVSG